VVGIIAWNQGLVTKIGSMEHDLKHRARLGGVLSTAAAETTGIPLGSPSITVPVEDEVVVARDIDCVVSTVL
jgi:hypothetical protein